MNRRTSSALLWSAVSLAAVSVGLAAGPLPWRLAGESGLPRPVLPASDGGAAIAVSIAPILDLAPFGRLVSASPAEATAEETTLGLTLHGVVIAAHPEVSTAIISSSEDPARVHVIGDLVGAAASLEAVFSDHVVLRVNGRPETLSFPQRGQAEARSGSGVDALRALVTSGDDDPAPAPTGVDPEAMIARYRDRIRDNPQTVLDGLGLVASEEGYRVGPSAPSTVLRAGLRPGDVVAKVNGQQVGNIEDDRRYFDDVAASGRARIELLRDGQRIVLSFPLQ